jgi:hypothetical protein
MSHAIDIDGLQETLFILGHLSLGSKNYCREEEIGSDIDVGEGEFERFWTFWARAQPTRFLSLPEDRAHPPEHAPFPWVVSFARPWVSPRYWRCTRLLPLGKTWSIIWPVR